MSISEYGVENLIHVHCIIHALQGLTKNIFSSRQGLPFAYGNIADKAAKPDGRSLLTTCTIPVDCGGQLYVQLNFFVYMASSLTGHWYGSGRRNPRVSLFILPTEC